jgi:Tfp pilus tip-associated adhesin PilY1
MLHAFYTNPADATDAKNGQEAWAFVPYDVAQRMLGDKTTGAVTAYPDGSPTLVNAKVYANWRSVVLMSEASGGRSIFALDVTDTIRDGTVVGPTPLWQFSDPAMGGTYSKPTVVRTKVANAETWMAIFASGPGAVGQGGVVYALDLSSGALLWKFDIGDPTAYVATDITSAETDDEASTSVDGYIDRVFFADNKGRVWKIDPSAAVHGVMGSIDSTVDVGLPHKALFATKVTPGALGQERAIAGTLTSAVDGSNRLVLYFGTGGTEDTPAAAQNAFYAVYADTGAVRSKLDASTGLAAGVKFYGGVVYQSGQIVFTQGQDLSGLGLCAPTAGSIVAIDANTFAQQFATNTNSKIVAPVFAQNGEIYTVTLKGSLMASSFSGSTGSASQTGSGTGSVDSTGGTTAPPTDNGTATGPFTILSWRQAY